MDKSLKSQMTGTHQSVLSNRADMLITQAKLAQEGLIKEKQAVVNKLKLQLNGLTDLAPTSTTALTIEGLLSSDPDKWVQDVHAIKVELQLAEEEVLVAQETYNEWFPDETKEVTV